MATLFGLVNATGNENDCLRCKTRGSGKEAFVLIRHRVQKRGMLTRVQRNILGCAVQNVIKDGDERV